jgi:hypothetical protein
VELAVNSPLLLLRPPLLLRHNKVRKTLLVSSLLPASFANNAEALIHQPCRLHLVLLRPPPSLLLQALVLAFSRPSPTTLVVFCPSRSMHISNRLMMQHEIFWPLFNI